MKDRRIIKEFPIVEAEQKVKVIIGEITNILGEI